MKFRITLFALLAGAFLLIFHSRSVQRVPEQLPASSEFRLYRQVRVNPIQTAPAAPVSKSQTPPVPMDGGWKQMADVLRGKTRSGTANQSKRVASKGFKHLGQAEAFDDLRARYGAGAELYLRPGLKTPMQLKGFNFRDPQAATAVEQAAVFLNNYQQLLLTQNAQAEWRLSHLEKDALGRTNVRFSQMYEGLEVFPAELSVHVNKDGAVDLLDGVFIPTPEIVDLQPKIEADRAVAKGVAGIPGGFKGKVSNTSLIIHAPIEGEPKLAWKFDLELGLTQNWMVVVDAVNGDVLKQINRCCTVNVSGSGTDLGGVTRTLNVWSASGVYYLLDTSKPMFNPATGEGIITVLDAQNRTLDQLLDGPSMTVVPSLNFLNWGNPHAVSAAYNLSSVYDYYLSQYGRDSYNGSKSNLVAVVNVAQFPNAVWTGNGMIFGNADKYAGSLDVAAHEVTHGVVRSVGAIGVLHYSSQSGALNEAFADIFGELAEAWKFGGNDWIIGTQLNTKVRNMIDPSQFGQPSKFSQYVPLPETNDQGGVHTYSGIINRAFYLLAEGLPNAVGKTKAGQIFYRCLTQHMKPLSQFVDARLGCITAAETLFGVDSVEAIKTAEAFDSVEIYAFPITATAARQDLPTVSGTDSTMFIYYDSGLGGYALGRRETAKGDPGVGVFLTAEAKLSKLSMSDDGADVAYVSSDNRLKVVSTTTGQLGFQSGTGVHSVAISPDGRYGALVLRDTLGNPTNQIVLLDFQLDTAHTNYLVSVGFDGASFERILYADTMNFSPDGSRLIYDTVATKRNADGTIGSAWSVYSIDMATKSQKLILPSVNGLSFGNPSFSHTSSRFITFEAQGDNGNAAVFTADLSEGLVAVQAITAQTTAYPVFSPDDVAVLYADKDLNSYSLKSMKRQVLSADKLVAVGSPTVWLQGPSLGVLYRRVTPAGLNTAPNITITSPASGTVLQSPGSTVITCNATDVDGTIQRVELFIGSKAVATNTVSPFSFTASGLFAGNYPIYLRAYDNLGASKTSSPINLRVQPPGGAPRFVTSGSKQFEMNLPVPSSGAYRVETSTNLVDWISVGTVYSSGNALNFSDFGVTNQVKRFYRAVKSQ